MPSSDEHRTRAEIVAEQLLKQTRATQDLIRKLDEGTVKNALGQEALKTEVANIKVEMVSLSKTLRDGNGQAPILTRLAVVESELSGLKSSVEEKIGRAVQLLEEKLAQDPNSVRVSVLETELAAIKSAAEDWKTVTRQNQSESTRGKWAVIVAIIMSLSGLITALVTFFSK